MTSTLKNGLILLIPAILVLGGCVGGQTFGTAARAGDTVIVEIGRQPKLARQNVTVTITDSIGAVTTYAPNDAHVRGIVNLYPDPASRAVVGTMTNQDLGNGATTTGQLINSFVTQDDDWFQSVMVLDLPPTMAIGTATISIAKGDGTNINPSNVTIVPGTGSSNLFPIYPPWNGAPVDLLATYLYPGILASMERADRYTVTFSSTVVPQSIQVAFTHTPGVGVPWVVNPRGDIKNVLWRDDGTTITIMLTPTQGTTLAQIRDFKFYIAGGITGLTQTGLKAYDINGAPISGVTATVD